MQTPSLTLLVTTIITAILLLTNAWVEDSDLYQVASVTDGDTIKVIIDDEIATVRIANINTPETVDPRRPVECFGKEASQKMSDLLENKQVFLETDSSQSEKDRYGRLIRFVFLEDGLDVGLEMIRLGYAYSSPYGSTPHKYLEDYTEAQNEAELEKRGLWNPGACPTSGILRTLGLDYQNSTRLNLKGIDKKAS